MILQIDEICAMHDARLDIFTGTAMLTQHAWPVLSLKSCQQKGNKTLNSNLKGHKGWFLPCTTAQLQKLSNGIT